MALAGETARIGTIDGGFEITLARNIDAFQAVDADTGAAVQSPSILADLYALNRGILQTEDLYRLAEDADGLSETVGGLHVLRGEVEKVAILSDARDHVSDTLSAVVNYSISGDLVGLVTDFTSSFLPEYSVEEIRAGVYRNSFDNMVDTAIRSNASAFEGFSDFRHAVTSDSDQVFAAREIRDFSTEAILTQKTASAASRMAADAGFFEGSVFSDVRQILTDVVEGAAETLADTTSGAAELLGFTMDIKTVGDTLSDFQAVAELARFAARYEDATDRPEFSDLGVASAEARSEYFRDFLENFEEANADPATEDTPDGPDQTASGDLGGTDGQGAGATSLRAPTFTADGDVGYTVSLAGIGAGVQYNVAYIIDRSGSMNGQKIEDARQAYLDLTDELVDLGIAGAANFAVIPFTSGASSATGLDAAEAQEAVAAIGAGGGTLFGPALAEAAEFFAGANTGQTNIAYFLSDGQGGGASDALTDVANVQAFGIGAGANLAQLDAIDSDTAVALEDSAQLLDAITGSGVDASGIDRVEIARDGTVVETLQPGVFSDGPLGLSHSGTIDGIGTAPGSETALEATVYLADGTAGGSAGLTIAAAGNEASVVERDATTLVRLNVFDERFDAASVATDTVDFTGNARANTVTALETGGIFAAMGGDDTFVLGDYTTSTVDRVLDGGAGFDTVQYDAAYDPDLVARDGAVTTVGTNTDTLTGIEEIQFTDAVLDAESLDVLERTAEALPEIAGTDGRDTLTGSSEAEVIRSLGGRYDTVTGGDGADLFVFGAETNDGQRDRDVIRDFDASEDKLVLADGASIAAMRDGGASVAVFFEGDHDAAYLRGADLRADSIAVVSDDAMGMA